MPRRRSLASFLFRTAHTVDDVEALASVNPDRIARRVKNRLLGRAPAQGWHLAPALGVSALSAISVDWSRLGDPAFDTAIATVGLALGTFLLAWSTWRSARATRRSVDLQVVEVDLFKRQLELAEAQATAARSAAIPRIRVTSTTHGNLYDRGSFRWAHGSGIAYNLEVWIRSSAGLRVAKHDFMTADDRELPFVAIRATETEVNRLPFPHFRQEVADTETWVGACWEGPDGSRDGFSEHTIQPKAIVDDNGEVSQEHATRTPGPGPAPKTSAGPVEPPAGEKAP